MNVKKLADLCPNRQIEDKWDIASVAGNSLLVGLAVGLYAKTVGSSRLIGRHFVVVGLAGAAANAGMQSVVSLRKPHFWLGKGESSWKEIAKTPWKTAHIWFIGIGGAMTAAAAITLIKPEVWEYLNKVNLPSRPTDDMLHQLMSTPTLRWETWCKVGVVAPILEEIVFRGFLFECCEGLRSNAEDTETRKQVSRAVQALIFGLAHTWDCKSLTGVLVNAAPRAVLGWFFVRQRTESESLLPSTLSHATHNSLVVLFSSAASSLM